MSAVAELGQRRALETAAMGRAQARTVIALLAVVLVVLASARVLLCWRWLEIWMAKLVGSWRGGVERLHQRLHRRQWNWESGDGPGRV